MFGAEVDYYRANSVAEAIQLLQEHDGSRLLAGGHSLIPLMKLRLAMPTALVDIGGIAELTRLPAALFVVDVRHEHIAISEAQKLNIPVFAMVDTNSDPTNIDFPIPANDDAFKSITVIVEQFSRALEEGLMERKKDKADAKLKEEEAEKKALDEASSATKEEGGAPKSEKVEIEEVSAAKAER